jgi:hypothetical protein
MTRRIPLDSLRARLWLLVHRRPEERARIGLAGP